LSRGKLRVERRRALGDYSAGQESGRNGRNRGAAKGEDFKAGKANLHRIDSLSAGASRSAVSGAALANRLRRYYRGQASNAAPEKRPDRIASRNVLFHRVEEPASARLKQKPLRWIIAH
jgi:hypothetical protein